MSSIGTLRDLGRRFTGGGRWLTTMVLLVAICSGCDEQSHSLLSAPPATKMIVPPGDGGGTTIFDVLVTPVFTLYDTTGAVVLHDSLPAASLSAPMDSLGIAYADFTATPSPGAAFVSDSGARDALVAMVEAVAATSYADGSYSSTPTTETGYDADGNQVSVTVTGAWDTGMLGSVETQVNGQVTGMMNLTWVGRSGTWILQKQSMDQYIGGKLALHVDDYISTTERIAQGPTTAPRVLLASGRGRLRYRSVFQRMSEFVKHSGDKIACLLLPQSLYAQQAISCGTEFDDMLMSGMAAGAATAKAVEWGSAVSAATAATSEAGGIGGVVLWGKFIGASAFAIYAGVNFANRAVVFYNCIHPKGGSKDAPVGPDDRACAGWCRPSPSQ